MYKNTQLHGNVHAYPDVGLCFLLISFVTVSSKMGLYAFYIYECQCFTFVSLSLSDHSLRFDSILFRFQPQWCTTRATRESHSRYPSFFFITNFFPTLISKFQCSIFCCLVVVVIFQEIGEEGLLDGDSGEEKVAESACR